MKRKQEILITGATGYLGSRLTHYFHERGASVFALRRDSSDPSRLNGLHNVIKFYSATTAGLETCYRQNQIDTVIHCATNYGRGGDDLSKLVEANFEFPKHVLELGLQSGIKTFINTDTTLDPSLNSYAETKRRFLDALETFANRLRIINVKLEHFYGPNDGDSKFVTWLIRSLLDKTEDLQLTEGRQRRDFIYIDDVCEAYGKLLEQTDSFAAGFRQYELGAGQTVEIREFVCTIARLLDQPEQRLRFGSVPYRSNEVMESLADTASLRALGWTPTVSIDEGLKRTVEFEKTKLKKRGLA